MIRHVENPPEKVIKRLAFLIHKTRWWDEVFQRPHSPVVDWQGHLISQRQYFKKMFGTPFGIELIVFFKDGILVSRDDDERINSFILEKYKTNRKYLFDFCRTMENDCNEFIHDMKKIDKEDFRSIIRYFQMRNYVTTYFRFVFNAASVIEPIVLKMISSPLKANLISQYNEKLDKLKKVIVKDKKVEKLLRERKIAQAIRILEPKEHLSSEIDKFIKEFYWIKVFHHIGDYLATEDLLKEMSQSMDSKFSREEFDRSEIEQSVRLLRYLIFLRTYAAETNAYCSALIKPTLTRLAEKYNLKHADMVYLTQKEIISLITNNRLSVPKKIIANRQKGYAVILKGNTSYFIYGDSFRSLKEYYDKFQSQNSAIEKNTIKTLKGAIASKGIARGRARIIKSVEDFNKFEKGDILVAPMTTPNFVPVLAKAAAIVTDEGGITCHAAIISRELGIPCIIGTKMATQVLHDGDMVEVDAMKGIVKIINKVK